MSVNVLRGDGSPLAKAIAAAGRQAGAGVTVTPETMTVRGTVDKTAILLTVVVASSVGAWRLLGATTGGFLPLVVGAAVGGLVVALVTTVKPHLAPVTAPIYAVLEGLVLGAISWLTAGELSEGVVALAVGATFATLGTMLLSYRTGLIRPTQRLARFLLVSMLGIVVTYLAVIVLSVFGTDTSALFTRGPVAVLISLFVIAVAALNLIFDFAFIEAGAEAGLGKSFEWYGAFGLVVTLVWLYVEILRLLTIVLGDDS